MNKERALVDGRGHFAMQEMAATMPDAPNDIRLRQLLLLETQDNVYIGHDDLDIYVPIGGITLDNVPDMARDALEALLDAQVKDIKQGNYGVEINLSGIDPQLILAFDDAHAQVYHQSPELLQ